MLLLEEVLVVLDADVGEDGAVELLVGHAGQIEAMGAEVSGELEEEGIVGFDLLEKGGLGEVFGHGRGIGGWHGLIACLCAVADTTSF